MISIDNQTFWQWDHGRRVKLHDVPAGTKVHFSNGASYPDALVMEAYEVGGGVYADVPNILLKDADTLSVYVFFEDEGEGRTVYKKTFVVREREKPVDYVYTQTEVYSIETLKKAISELAEKVEKVITSDQLAGAIETALSEAKESGEFDGSDYVLTEEDIAEIAKKAADMVGGGGAAGGLIRPLSTIGEIDGVTVEHVPDRDRVDLTVEMTAESMDSVFGGNAVYKNDFLNVRQLQLMFRIPGAGRLFLWELFEDDLITVTNYPNKKFIMVSTNRMIVSFTYDENGQFVSETKTYQANVQQIDEAKATIPNSATVNEANELVMQRTDGDAVSELFKVKLPQGDGSSIIIREW